MKHGRLRRRGVIRRKPKSINQYGKARMNFMLPAELYYWVQGYADERRTSVTQLILDHFKQLKAEWEKNNAAEQI